MDISIKASHYEIVQPDENDLVFCFHGQGIYLTDAKKVPTYREFLAFSKSVSSCYCFAETSDQRYLLIEDVEILCEKPEISLVFLKQLAHALPQALFSVALQACHLNYWRKTHRFCGCCGTKLVEMENERARRCESCMHVTYPRISPCIIVLVARGEEMLLARSAHFSPEVYSTLAGFIEPGESAEEAVHREILEEVGVHVKNVRYFSSQPWPFPDSLMLAFTADYESGEISIDPKEIEDAKWYGPENLPKLPTTFSIARALIEQHLRVHGLQTKY
jgi:NAD+ diphosphatase